MAKKTRRQSQNTRYMQQVLLRLREYDLDEVRGLCQKYLMQKGRMPVIDEEDEIELDDDDPALLEAAAQAISDDDDEDDDLILLRRQQQEPEEEEPEPEEDEEDFGEYPGDHHLEEDDGLDLDEILKE